MGQKVRTYATYQAFCEAAQLGLSWPAPTTDLVAESNLAIDTMACMQGTSPLLPGVIAWFVDGMKMEARAERWY